MNRVNGIVNRTTLGVLLAIQVVIVGVLLAARSGGIEEPEPFLRFDAASVDSLSVSNNDGSVIVSKVDGEWQLANGIPAAGVKVDSVLEGLSDASGSWPVANTQSTRDRFEVTEENHQRHIVVNAGDDTLADVYLGTSPGYRKTHARRAGDDEVFAIAFSNYEAGVKAADWLDRSLLRPEGEITALRRLPSDSVPAAGQVEEVSETDDEEPVEPIAGFELSKDEEGGWVSGDRADLDQGKVETFAGRFKGLSATGVSETILPESATMTFVLTDEEGEKTLSVFSLEDGEKYVAVSDRVPGAYELSKYIAEQMNKPLADLVPDPPEDEDAEESEATSETAPAVASETAEDSVTEAKGEAAAEEVAEASETAPENG